MQAAKILSEVGFEQTIRGGWWMRHPENNYTIQIFHRGAGWGVGISKDGPIVWGRRTFQTPLEAAHCALVFVGDELVIDSKVDTLLEGNDAVRKAAKKKVYPEG